MKSSLIASMSDAKTFNLYVAEVHSRLDIVYMQWISSIACIKKDGKILEMASIRKTLVKTNVKHFYVDGELGLAIVNMNDTLSLATNSEINLKAKVDSEAKWTIVTSNAKYWIVCGDLESEGHSIMASISRQGYVRSILKLKLTSNGYINDKHGTEYSGILTLHQAYLRGRRGIMLAIERDGCCHLISVAYGRL